MALRSDQRLKQADKVFLDRHSLSLSSAPCTQTSRGSYSLSVCVWLGVVAVVLGLSTFLCVCTFPCVVLNACFFYVCLRVSVQPSVFVQDLFFETDCE